MTLLFCVLFACVSHGAAAPKVTPVQKPVPAQRPTPVRVIAEPEEARGPKGFSVGAVTGYIDYKEPGLMREYGEMFGANGSYTSIHPASSLLWNLEGELVVGRILYDGGSVDSNNNVKRFTQATSDYIFNFRALIGLYGETGPVALTPFIGLGYRVLNDKIDGSGSYNRNISYVYIPVGGQIAALMGERWTLTFAADFDFMPSGTVVSNLSEADSSFPDVTNKNKGYGGRATIRLREFSGRFGWHVGAFYQKWKIDKSDVVTVTTPTKIYYFAEPDNESDFIGLNAGLDF